MSQRFNLFIAGYSVNAPSLHFELLAVNFQLSNQATGLESSQLLNATPTLENETIQHLEKVNEIARMFELELPVQPETNSGYAEWRRNVNSIFEVHFPMTKIDHYYYLFGRRLAELESNSIVLNNLIPFLYGVHKNDIVISRCQKYLKDNEYLIFKMMAPTALLSGEYGHHHFSVFYKELSNAFKSLTGLELKSIHDDDLISIQANLENFSQILTNGLQKSKVLLEGLGV